MEKAKRERFISKKVLPSYMVEITKISSKGQVVIPMKIRRELDLEEGARLVVNREGSFVMMKKLDVESALREFGKVVVEGEKIARAHGVKSEEDFVKIIHERRKKTRAESGF